MPDGRRRSFATRTRLMARVRDVLRDDRRSRRRESPAEEAARAVDLPDEAPDGAAPRAARRAAHDVENELRRLEAEARYHRERLALYRARMQGPGAGELSKLRRLERAAQAADERLEHARRA